MLSIGLLICQIVHSELLTLFSEFSIVVLLPNLLFSY